METIEYKGYKIEIEIEPYPINPRIDFDHLGTIACYHKKYDLGDKGHFSLSKLLNLIASDAVFALPLYAYEHSSISSLSLSNNTYPYNDLWDSGQLGFIYASWDKLEQEYGKLSHDELASKATISFQHEIEEYNTYLLGEIYNYEITKDDSFVDACSNFYGYDHVVSSAKEVIDSFKDESLIQV